MIWQEGKGAAEARAEATVAAAEARAEAAVAAAEVRAHAAAQAAAAAVGAAEVRAEAAVAAAEARADAATASVERAVKTAVDAVETAKCANDERDEFSVRVKELEESLRSKVTPRKPKVSRRRIPVDPDAETVPQSPYRSCSSSDSYDDPPGSAQSGVCGDDSMQSEEV